MKTILGLVLTSIAIAAAAVAQTSVAGDWALTEDVYGNPLHRKLVLKVDGDKLSGTIGTSPIDGTISGPTVHFTAKSDGSTDEFSGMIAHDGLSGTVVHTERDDPHPMKTTWSARRLPQRPF